MFNGNAVDGGKRRTDVDINSGKDLAGRIVVLPVSIERHAAVALEQCRVPSRRIGRRPDRAPPVVPDDCRPDLLRVSGNAPLTAPAIACTPAVFLYVKAFGGFAEYARTTHGRLSQPGRHLTVTNHAWGVTAGHVLTGEIDVGTRREGHAPAVRPGAGDLGRRSGRGRYAELAVDDELFTAASPAPTRAARRQQLTFAANWYLDNYMKFYGTFERLDVRRRERAAERELIICSRLQLAF